MKITTGYSREHPGGQKWSKVDITLEEVDFGRFLAENDIDPDTTVSPAVVYQLMWLEAERYMVIHQAAEKLIDNSAASTEVGNLRKRQNEILDKIRKAANGAV